MKFLGTLFMGMALAFVLPAGDMASHAAKKSKSQIRKECRAQYADAQGSIRSTLINQCIKKGIKANK